MLIWSGGMSGSLRRRLGECAALTLVAVASCPVSYTRAQRPGEGAPPSARDQQPTEPTTPVRVVVLDPQVRPGLVAAVRIQLGAGASVDMGAALTAAGAATRVAHARAVLSRDGGGFAVWVELTEREALLYVVGSRDERALLEIVRIPADESSDLDRALALKLADIIDSTARFALDEEPPAMAAPSVREEPPSSTAGVQVRGEVEWRLAAPAGSAPVQTAVGGGVGLAAAFRPLWLEGVAGVDGVFAARLADGDRGTVTTSEFVPWLAFRALADLGWLALGAGLRANLRVVFAEGVSPLGNIGDSTVFVPSVALAGIGVLRIVGGLSVRVRFGLEGAFVRQRFLVNSQSLGDLGGVRFFAALGIGFRTE